MQLRIESQVMKLKLNENINQGTVGNCRDGKGGDKSECLQQGVLGSVPQTGLYPFLPM